MHETLEPAMISYSKQGDLFYSMGQDRKLLGNSVLKSRLKTERANVAVFTSVV